jgi:inosose dehydratase
MIRLATGPVSWGVDFADAPSNPPWAMVLDDIAQTGLGALELGPVGYLPEDPTILQKELSRRGLTAVGSFVFEDFHEPSAHDAIVLTAERACRAIVASEGDVLVIIDRVGLERQATFGRSLDARRLTGEEWESMLGCVRRVAAIADSHGLAAAFHPHAGGYVEFEDEIDRLLGDTELELCFDTGHAALAGIDVPTAIAKYASRLRHLHLKDIDGDVLELARAQKMTFWDALTAGVFCPLGRGIVPFSRVATELAQTGYRGFATIEQDRTPGTGSPLDDIASSLQVLADAGFDHARDALAAPVRPASSGPR